MIEWFSMLVHATLGAFLASVTIKSPNVRLGGTNIVGIELPDSNVEFFGGIPYAEAPLGPLRLRPPFLKTRLAQGTFDASSFGKACLQPSHTPHDTGGIQPEDMSEDCLTLNVFRPAGISSDAALPILFWSHGGGFFWGGSQKYDGSSIVSHSVARGTPVIYVNFNYRLGPLGFPQGQEAHDNGMLNLGLKDQLAALQWIQENIGSFGGDPKKVTMFGQSGGAVMTAVQFLNPEIEKYARAAIFQSGSAATPTPSTAESREGRWQDFVSEVPSCHSLSKTGDTFTCLRNANSSEMFDALRAVLNNQPEFHSYRLTIDGPGGLLPESPSQFYARGDFARLPFIAGTVLDEGTIFFPRAMKEDLLKTWIAANFTPSTVSQSALEERAEELIRMYPDEPAFGSPFGTGDETFGASPVWKKASAIYGDIYFQSLRRQWIRAAAGAGVKTYGYLITEPQPETQTLGLGVHHSADIPILYGSANKKTPSAKLVSEIMMDYWISFAVHLDPNDQNGASRPRWEEFTMKNRVLMQLNGENTTQIPDTYRSEQIDFINASPLVFLH